jgi:hypothetical protein
MKRSVHYELTDCQSLQELSCPAPQRRHGCACDSQQLLRAVIRRHCRVDRCGSMHTASSSEKAVQGQALSWMQLAAHPSGSLGRIASPSRFRLHRPNRTPYRTLLLGGRRRRTVWGASLPTAARRVQNTQRLGLLPSETAEASHTGAVVSSASLRQLISEAATSAYLLVRVQPFHYT